MKKLFLILLCAIAFIFLINLLGQDFSYVGARKCRICHKGEKQGKQYPIWEQSKHFQSFSVLTKDELIEKTKTQGMDPLPAENLKCHSPLNEKAPDFKEEGVTCEVCHGPGSAYKKLKIMKSREESVKKGFIAYDSKEAIKAKCLNCHKNAHEKPFDFEGAWKKIEHPKPEKK